MKRLLILFIVALLTLSLAVVYGAEEVTVYVNDVQVVSDVPAVVVNGSTMLPFRAIFNALGVGDDAITWSDSSKSIVVSYDDKYIFLAIGSSGAIIKDNMADKMITLNTAPYIENDRTYVPVRFVSEALGAQVTWDEGTKTVKIKK